MEERVGRLETMMNEVIREQGRLTACVETVTKSIGRITEVLEEHSEALNQAVGSIKMAVRIGAFFGSVFALSITIWGILSH